MSILRTYNLQNPDSSNVNIRLTQNGGVVVLDGKIGIGTENPDTQLQVFGSSTTGHLKLGGGNGAGNHRVFISCTETNSYIDSYGNNAYGKLRINAAPLLLNDTGGGSVSIGTNNPESGSKLTVNGGIFVKNYLTAATIHGGGIDYVNDGRGTRITSYGASGAKTAISFAQGNGGSGASEIARFDTNGNLVFASSGQGIDFSADGNASGNQSEVLNDYEEGYATATMTCGTSGTITLSNDEVSYVKVGDLVNIHGRLDVLSVSSPNGELIVNLPFNAANEGNGAYASHSAVSLFIWSANSGAGYSQTGLWVGWISPNDNKMRIRYGSTATPAGSGAGGMQAGTEVRFTATFRTV